MPIMAIFECTKCGMRIIIEDLEAARCKGNAIRCPKCGNMIPLTLDKPIINLPGLSDESKAA
ncbi:hypothetical protein DRN74_05840 [Candidatus Micrarchaeota archaeon]|nr:MAG: hypothetical protein DRN74_05840 [Candidatus Micrarchaeota archaeon]